MNPRNLWKSSALALSLLAPAAMAEWRDDGSLRQNQDGSSSRGSEKLELATGESMNTGGISRSNDGTGFSLGLRVGYGVPIGKFSGGDSGDMSDVVSGIIPLQLDGGYYITSHLYLGASFQYSRGLLAEDCQEGVSCSLSVLRLGANVAYHFSPLKTVDPWAGLGVGYETLKLSESATQGGANSDLEVSASGIEFAAFQGGIDIRLGENLSMGPFATFTLGQYSTSTVSLGDSSESSDIEQKAIHSWLSGGARVQYRF